MNSNLHYFEMAVNHTEQLIDPNYHLAIEKKIIPVSKEVKNDLTRSNEKVVQYITTIHTLMQDLNRSIESEEVVELIRKIIYELATKGMNCSAFCQYFNVHNMNYSLFDKKTEAEKIQIIQFIIQHYIADRHSMYLSHGYSDIVFQVMCDNYSHKRKGSYGANKIATTLKSKGLVDLAEEQNQDFARESYFLLADKTGKKLFKQFAKSNGISLSETGRNTEKFPDALIKIGSDFYIVEQKNMKEDGGGQDKQAREITDFIYREPEFRGLHYVTYMDGVYFNSLNEHASAKKRQQYDDVVQALNHFEMNYFVNEYAFNELMQDVMIKQNV